ncbi:hypothetical protein IWQ60_002952 [Tieghemiomyces parasiticus]|uniref:Homeobox domain-containing protein n=1 Tax=Tieghemiomyces parasiticus TaxID=78921 RepID=A0A9W8DWX3_9FUNG|nr:hypothetical protein IWQ60_002952 [Tieghemiomyces parasiticus]
MQAKTSPSQSGSPLADLLNPEALAKSEPTSPATTEQTTAASLPTLAPVAHYTYPAVPGSPAKPKRRKITEEQLKLLTEVFAQTDTPNYEIREDLSKRLHMTNRDIQVWFQNRRAKVNRERANAQALRYQGEQARHGRCRSISDAGIGMAYQFVPIVSCDQSKTGGAAMSQSQRGYRNPHPPLAPHHPHAVSPYRAAPAVRVLPLANGPLRTRRGSHSVGGPRGVPYAVGGPAKPPVPPVPTPAFGALSLSPTFHAGPLHSHPSHRPAPLPMPPHGYHYSQHRHHPTSYPTPGSSSPHSPDYPPYYSSSGYSGTAAMPFPHPIECPPYEHHPHLVSPLASPGAHHPDFASPTRATATTPWPVHTAKRSNPAGLSETGRMRSASLVTPPLCATPGTSTPLAGSGSGNGGDPFDMLATAATYVQDKETASSPVRGKMNGAGWVQLAPLLTQPLSPASENDQGNSSAATTTTTLPRTRHDLQRRNTISGPPISLPSLRSILLPGPAEPSRPSLCR